MRTKILSILIILTIVVSLAGCNSNKTNNGSNNNSNNSEIVKYIDRADELLADKKYDEAMAQLETAEQLYGANDAVAAKKRDIKKEKGLSQLEQYESESNYKDAILYINDNFSDFSTDEDILNKKNLYVTKYREDVLSEAKNALETNGYKEAVQILQDALEVLNNDTQISNKIIEYREYEPVPLKNLKATASNDGYEFSSSMSDPRGETNVDVLHLESYVEFYAGKQYSKFTATIDPAEHFKTSDYAGVQLKIHADNVVVYKSPTITYKTDNLSVSVDIANAKYLKFELVYVGGTQYSEHWNADAILICDPFVAK